VGAGCTSVYPVCFLTVINVNVFNVIRLTTFIFVLFAPCHVLGGPLGEFDLRGLATGAIGMIVGHEIGHFAVAESMNVKAEFDGVTVVYPNSSFTSRQHLRVASAGFQSQWLLSELAFHYLDKPDVEQRSVATGAVLAHIAITAAYLTFLKNNKDGDVIGMATALGKSRSNVALTLALPALLDTWRLFGEPPDWVPHLSRIGKGLGVAWVWNK
jgi:hypothetical protein